MKHPRWHFIAIAVLLLIFTIFSCPLNAADRRHMATPMGLITGTDTRVDGVSAFHGIPYAIPPVGEARWRAPQPPEPWEGVRDGSVFGNRCIQTNPFDDMIWNSAQESEDCLYLSVWAPEDSAELPVMVWIHGGGYSSGSGDEARHDAARLASEGVVVVTLNYRLGILGFLAHEELTAEAGQSGNYGLLDVIAALQWVHGNIAAFGGDPQKVTIFGESAGSFAVSSLMASPLANGLFHRAIGQSGAQLDSGSRPLQTMAQAEIAGAAFASAVGADSMSELRAIPPEQLVKKATEREQWFWPVEDNHVFPSNTGKVQQAALLNDVPLLTGWTSAEAKWIRQSTEEFQAALRQRFPDHLESAAAYYPAATEEEALRMGVMLESDFWLVHATWRWAERQRLSGTSPVYLYLFDQVQAGKDAPIAPNDPGAAHATDIPFVFDTLDYLGNPVGPEDRETTGAMMKYWARFALNGDPNIEGLPAWSPYTEANGFPVMRFKSGAKLEPDANRERQLFIKTVYSSR